MFFSLSMNLINVAYVTAPHGLEFTPSEPSVLIACIQSSSETKQEIDGPFL